MGWFGTAQSQDVLYRSASDHLFIISISESTIVFLWGILYKKNTTSISNNVKK